MNLEKIVGNEKKYLASRELVEGMIAERVAYLVRIKRKLDVNGNPFLTFFLKTVDGVTLVGRKFRIEETDSIGINILSLNRSIVSVRFEVQLFNGSYSLLVRELRQVQGEDPGRFFDSYPEATAVFEQLNSKALECGAGSLDRSIKSASLFSVQCGLSGAFVGLVDMVYKTISARQTPHTHRLVKCLLLSVNPYFTYLRLLDHIEFLPKKEILALLQDVCLADDDLSSVVADVLSALMKQGNPEHLYAHIIVNAFTAAKRQLELEEAVKSSPKNLVIEQEGSRVIFY